MRLPPARSTAHLYEIEGYGRPVQTRRVGRRWLPLYQYADGHEAAKMLKVLNAMPLSDLMTRDPFFRAWEVEQFRLVPPDPRADFLFQRKALRKGRWKGRTVRPSTRVEAARQRTIVGRSGVRLRGPRAIVVGGGRRG